MASRCAVVGEDGIVINVIIADPGVDVIEGAILIECDRDVHIGCAWDGSSFGPGPEELARIAAEEEAERQAVEAEAQEE